MKQRIGSNSASCGLLHLRATKRTGRNVTQITGYPAGLAHAQELTLSAYPCVPTVAGHFLTCHMQEIISIIHEMKSVGWCYCRWLDTSHALCSGWGALTVGSSNATAFAKTSKVTPEIFLLNAKSATETQYLDGIDPRRFIALAVPYSTPMSCAKTEREGHRFIISECFISSKVQKIPVIVNANQALFVPGTSYNYYK